MVDLNTVSTNSIESIVIFDCRSSVFFIDTVTKFVAARMKTTAAADSSCLILRMSYLRILPNCCLTLVENCIDYNLNCTDLKMKSVSHYRYHCKEAE